MRKVGGSNPLWGAFFLFIFCNIYFLQSRHVTGATTSHPLLINEFRFYMLMRLNTSNIKLSEHELKQNFILPNEITSELAEEIGLHIGDGTMNFYKNEGVLRGSYALRGHIIEDKPHYDIRIKKLYKQLYNLDLNLKEMPSTRVYGFQKWSNALVNFKNKVLDLPLGKKISIEIPKILFNKNEFLISVLRGIFDTDGTVYLEPKNSKLYPRLHIATISKNLACQMNQISKTLNIRSTVYFYHRKAPWYTIYMFSVRGEEMLDKWFKIIKPANPKHIRKYEFFLTTRKLYK